MIDDKECNKVYLSDLMQKAAPATYSNLTAILDRWKVDWEILDGTKDIWCRDFMPLQVSENRFAVFRYNPDYLRDFKKYRNSITDGAEILSSLALECEVDDTLRDVLLDGGNVVRCANKVVMTAKVFEENPFYRPVKLLDLLEKTFGAEVIVIPWDPHEIFGHSDGVCRYVEDDTLLLTSYRQIDPKMARRFCNCLAPHFKNIVELEFHSPGSSKFRWAHINWLQTDKVIVVPAFEDNSFDEAIEQIGHLMPSYAGRIVPCHAEDLVSYGGALNCCSWTVCV